MSANKRKPRRFGLVGHPLGHSLSPFIHRGILESLGTDGDYQLLDLAPDALQASFPKLAELDGYNITIPYKETFYQLAPRRDPLCERMRTCNTIYEGVAYNTDIYGFAHIPITYEGRKVLILGAGGTARMMAFHVADQGATSIMFMTRTESRAERLMAELRAAYPGCRTSVLREGAFNDRVQKGRFDGQVILNATPVGMWPKMGALPLPERAYKRLLRSKQVEAVFDAIYNPTATRFMLIARSHGVQAYGGAGMLFGQALAAQAIWHDRPPTADIEAWTKDPEQRAKLRQVAERLNQAIAEHSPMKWVITGFMGSGKSRMAKRLGQMLPFPVKVFDLDKEIVKDVGMSIEDFFAAEGEEAFRKRERDMLLELLTCDEATIIATGGGTITQKGMARQIHAANGIIINLNVSLRTARQRIGDGRGRPLAQGEGAAERLRALFEKRSPIYRLTADLIVDANRYPPKVANVILDAFGLKAKPTSTPLRPKPAPSSSRPKKRRAYRRPPKPNHGGTP